MQRNWLDLCLVLDLVGMIKSEDPDQNGISLQQE